VIIVPFRLGATDVARYMRLRRRMLEDAPWAFAATPDDDLALDPGNLARLVGEEQEAIFAIEADEFGARSSAAAASGVGGGSAPGTADGVGAVNPPDEPSAPPLAAAAGIYRQKRPKFAHRAALWGVYVAPEHRGRGFGRAVIAAALNAARFWPGVEYVDLGVSENSPEALRLYLAFGFRQWGREPESLIHLGRRYDEIFMTLRLEERKGT
jgi:ribosomal protein S18 acetylase RimI-like enzyme